MYPFWYKGCPALVTGGWGGLWVAEWIRKQRLSKWTLDVHTEHVFLLWACIEQPLYWYKVSVVFGMWSHVPRRVRAVTTQYIPWKLALGRETVILIMSQKPGTALPTEATMEWWVEFNHICISALGTWDGPSHSLETTGTDVSHLAEGRKKPF